MRNFMGYQKIISDHKMRNLGYYRTFDEVINFAGFLTTTRTLRTDDYYQCAEEKLGKPVKEPGFWSFPEGAERVWQDTVAIHPGASNPNRHWNNEEWEKLAFSLAATGKKVVWLGPRNEFGFNATNIFKLSDTDETLEGQAKFLLRCGYFIGTDSGFAHVAGTGLIPGKVLFFSTSPEAVIARYPSLEGVKAYNKAGIEPSFSLDPEDENAKISQKALKYDDICPEKCDLAVFSGPKNLPIRFKINIISKSENSELHNYLRTTCDVTTSTNFQENADINILPLGTYGVLSNKNRELRTSLSDFNILNRALWEFRALST